MKEARIRSSLRNLTLKRRKEEVWS